MQVPFIKIGRQHNSSSADWIFMERCRWLSTRNEVPAYIYSGMPLPQQDEIKAIEVELNKRYQAGDKSAELKEFWPSARRHIASGGRFENTF